VSIDIFGCNQNEKIRVQAAAPGSVTTTPSSHSSASGPASSSKVAPKPWWKPAHIHCTAITHYRIFYIITIYYINIRMYYNIKFNSSDGVKAYGWAWEGIQTYSDYHALQA
jgi:hypothetical protein